MHVLPISIAIYLLYSCTKWIYRKLFKKKPPKNRRRRKKITAPEWIEELLILILDKKQMPEVTFCVIERYQDLSSILDCKALFRNGVEYKAMQFLCTSALHEPDMPLWISQEGRLRGMSNYFKEPFAKFCAALPSDTAHLTPYFILCTQTDGLVLICNPITRTCNMMVQGRQLAYLTPAQTVIIVHEYLKGHTPFVDTVLKPHNYA